jgi:hypothetical protein
MASLASGPCVALPEFTELRGHVDRSRAGALLGRAGRLHVSFDSARTASGRWIRVSAVIDALEWYPAAAVDSTGEIRAPRHSMLGTLGRGGAARLAGGLLWQTGAAATLVSLLHHGPRVVVTPGEEGTVRLTAPVDLPDDEPCLPRTWNAAPAPMGPGSAPPVATAALPARTEQRGHRAGDPVNLILLGTPDAVRAAFTRAGWTEATSANFGSRAREVGAAILGKSYQRAPVSHQYLQGLRETLAFERMSPTVRRRHHVRLWPTDSTDRVWLAAATEDVGLSVNPFKGRATHRIASDVDRERDLIGGELVGGGCATTGGTVRLAGAVRQGTNAYGQQFTTDGNAVVLRLDRCAPASAPASFDARPRPGSAAPPE